MDAKLSSYSYELPPELIAQTPAEPRDSARLLVLDRQSGAVQHRVVRDLPTFLHPGDVLVANRSRVLPSRLVGRKASTGGRVELLLLRPLSANTWEALVGGRRVGPQTQVVLAGDVRLKMGQRTEAGRVVRFPPDSDPVELLHRYGRVPLPPYIHEYSGDAERYQTVYATEEGSAAAPTAGLHFTPELLQRLGAAGVGWGTVLLHVGLDTFKPMADEDIDQHRIHNEWIEVSQELVRQVDETKARGGRVVAVGTTTVRALEHAARNGELRPYHGLADLFITPGFQFRVVDVLMTNFHMPRSSLLLLVSAIAGRERVLAAYDEAIRARYRLLSFGDAMLIL